MWAVASLAVAFPLRSCPPTYSPVPARAMVDEGQEWVEPERPLPGHGGTFLLRVRLHDDDVPLDWNRREGVPDLLTSSRSSATQGDQEGRGVGG